MANGTSFEIDVDVQSDGIEPAAAQLATLGEQLLAAGKASEAAAAAVKTSEAAYRQAETGANRAALAVEKMTVAADAQRAKLDAVVAQQGLFSDAAVRAALKLDNLIARQGEAVAKSDAAKASLAQEAASLDKVKAAAASAADAEAKLSKQLDQAKNAASSAAKAKADADSKTAAAAKSAAAANAQAIAAAQGSGKVNEIAEGLGKLGGPLGQMGQKAFGAAEGFKKLSASLGEAGPYAAIAVAIVAIVAGVAALGVAAAVAIAHVTAFAVSLADAARSQRILAEGITQSVAGGAALDAAIGSLENRVPVARDELLRMAGDLEKTGLKGGALADALEDAAVKAAQAKFGPQWEKQLLSLDSQTARFKRNVAGLFGGLKIEGLLEGLAKLIALFDSSTASGRAIKVVFESLFQPLVDGFVAWVPQMERAFIRFQILVLQALIAIKPFGTYILYGAAAIGILAALIIGVLAVAIGAVVFSVGMLAVGFGIIVGVIAAVVYGFIWLGGQAVALGEAIGEGAGAAYEWLVDTFNSIVSFLEGLSLAEIGMQLITGLVDGISGGGGAVLSAITGVVGGAIDAAKKLLGIASPSKVFADIGMNTGAGMASGVDQSTGDVQGALEQMVAPPPVPVAAGPAEGSGGAASSPAAPSGASSSGGGAFAGATFIFQGVEGAQDAEGRFSQLLTWFLEGDVAQIAAKAAPATNGGST